MKKEQLPLKTPSQTSDENPYYHIHVDAQEEIPDNVARELRSAGLSPDMFDPSFHIMGLGGDLDKKFPHHAPIAHWTLATSNTEVFKSGWDVVVDIMARSGIVCYVEGEEIVYDCALTPKPFCYEEFERITGCGGSTKFGYKSAILNRELCLPGIITTRRLNPKDNGKQDRFRAGEVHLTVLEDGAEPLFLELLANLSLSAPAIPKILNGKIVRDIPFTLQTKDMKKILQFANLLNHLAETIGGFADASIKIELAVKFAILSGVDYYRHIPPVLDTLLVREDIEPEELFTMRKFAQEKKRKMIKLSA